jgi:hypothetical protein
MYINNISSQYNKLTKTRKRIVRERNSKEEDSQGEESEVEA